MRIGTLTSGQCLLVVPSPTDEDVYGCFRSIARRWREHVTDERLWIQGDVPITAALTTPTPSPALAKLSGSNSDIISRIELRFGGLLLTFVRSGGHGPAIYRQSYFDEIRAECRRTASMDPDEVVEVFREICECLKARRGMGTREFKTLLTKHQLDITMDTLPT